MGSQALRTDFNDLEEEDRFFISGVEKVGRSRNTYEYQLKKRKVVVGVLIAVGSLGLVALIIGLAYGLSRRQITYVCPRTYDASNTDLVFYVVGDWGRSGNDNQLKTARLMADVSECMPPSFVISTGDNFYPNGLGAPDDPIFNQSFTNVYTAPGLQVPWYAVMGNHDYGDAVDPSTLTKGNSANETGCLRAPTSEEQCRGRCCISPYWETAPGLNRHWNATLGNVVTRRFPLGGASGSSSSAAASGDSANNNTLDILFMDTVPFIYSYRDRIWSSFLYGVNNQSADAIRSQLEQQLNASYLSGSKWRLVVGHHPIWSYGVHCAEEGSDDCRYMASLIPYLNRYRVAAYINGHEHDQQLIKPDDESVYYVVSGAGSDVRVGEFDNLDSSEHKDALFLSDRQGFVAVVLSGDSMRLHFYTTGQSGPTYTRVISAPN